MIAPGLYARYGKRAFDIVGASAGTVLLLPVAAFLAGLIWCFLGAPVLFRHRRPGLHGVPFTLIKFRSMTDRRDSSGRLLPDAERLTTLGRWLRASSLDEIPELWHVLTGEMSLVGPRPLLMKYLPLYTPQQARRHDVRPGITGLAQVKGRNGLSWQERFELDLYYVEHCSLELDLRILARTALEVLARRGIAQPGRATVDDFHGTSSEAPPQTAKPRAERRPGGSSLLNARPPWRPRLRQLLEAVRNLLHLARSGSQEMSSHG